MRWLGSAVERGGDEVGWQGNRKNGGLRWYNYIERISRDGGWGFGVKWVRDGGWWWFQARVVVSGEGGGVNDFSLGLIDWLGFCCDVLVRCVYMN